VWKLSTYERIERKKELGEVEGSDPAASPTEIPGNTISKGYGTFQDQLSRYDAM